MNELYEILRGLQLIVFPGLALVALLQWRRRAGKAAAWLAATFSVLAIVVVVSRLLPEQSDSATVTWIRKLNIGLLALFPYFLWRFHLCFIKQARWFYVIAHVLTALAVVGALLVPEFPRGEEAESPVARWYIYLLLFQWSVLSLRVAVRLWRAGGGRPTVTRRRMRTLSLGSVGLVVALVLAGTAPDTEGATAEQVAIQLFAIASGPLFLLGFAPPGIVRMAWRRHEEAALRQAEVALMKAEDPSQVAEVLLPHVGRLVGTGGSVLVGLQGEILGRDGVDEEEAKAMAVLVSRDQTDTHRDPREGAILTVPMQSGWLGARTSAFTPFFGEDELGILRDIATSADLALARVDLLQKERQSALELRAANEAMRDFVAIASHDLRTPITVMRGFLTGLERQWETLGDAKKLEYLATIRRQTGQLANLINDLLTVSQIDAGAVLSQPEVIDVGQVAQGAVEALDHDGSDIEVAVPAGVTVHADPVHVNRILANFMTNALIYGDPPIEVDARANGEWVEVRVRDHGDGVPDDFVPDLFQKFARVNRKRSKANQGTGLGLSIARGLARAGGGDAWYEPNEPTGSCFGIRLPRVVHKTADSLEP